LPSSSMDADLNTLGQPGPSIGGAGLQSIDLSGRAVPSPSVLPATTATDGGTAPMTGGTSTKLSGHVSPSSSVPADFTTHGRPGPNIWGFGAQSIDLSGHGVPTHFVLSPCCPPAPRNRSRPAPKRARGRRRMPPEWPHHCTALGTGPGGRRRPPFTRIKRPPQTTRRR